jgi:hypothetical protein
MMAGVFSTVAKVLSIKHLQAADPLRGLGSRDGFAVSLLLGVIFGGDLNVS